MATLTSVFTDIGNAIRAKDKTTAAIPVTQMASRISAIKTWTPSEMVWRKSNGNNYAGSACYANGLWVSGSGESYYHDSYGLYYSTDGKTWTQSNRTSGYYTVRYLNDRWVANDLYSTDGKSWEGSIAKKSDGSSVYLRSYMYGNGTWVAGTSYDGIWYSTDFINWTLCLAESAQNYYISYANGIWTASLYSSVSVLGTYYSTNGRSWTKISSPSNERFDTITYGNGVWVAKSGGSGGSYDNSLWYSTDGKNWTESNYNRHYIQFVHYANGVWVTGNRRTLSDTEVGDGLWYSTDGKTWTQSNVETGAFGGAYYANGMWVACSWNHGIWYSTDGISWISTTLPYDCHFINIYYGNGVWVACDFRNPSWYLTQ